MGADQGQIGIQALVKPGNVLQLGQRLIRSSCREVGQRQSSAGTGVLGVLLGGLGEIRLGLLDVAVLQIDLTRRGEGRCVRRCKQRRLQGGQGLFRLPRLQVRQDQQASRKNGAGRRLDRLVQISLGLQQRVGLQFDGPGQLQAHGVFGRALDHLLRQLAGQLEVLLLVRQQGCEIARLRAVGRSLLQQLELLGGFVKLAATQQAAQDGAVALHIIGLDIDRLSVSRECLGSLGLCVQQDIALELPCLVVARRGGENGVYRRQRRIELATRCQQACPHQERRRVGRIRRERRIQRGAR